MALIDWKQQGLNRPNIYYILKFPVPVSTNGNSGPENISGPDRKLASVQDRKPASDKEDSTKNTHTVVNDVTANDHKDPSGRVRPKTRTPAISDRALRSKYQLADDQIGQVYRLVDKQIEILAAGDRNHAAYVKRAAEAVRDGLADALDFKLSEFKQAATEIAVGSQPAYFHAMWSEEREKHGTSPNNRPNAVTAGPQRLGTLITRPDSLPVDPRLARLIADAERRGFPVPDHIRSGDINAANRWWATILDSEATKS